MNQDKPTPECEVNGTECYHGWVWVTHLILYVVMVTCGNVSAPTRPTWDNAKEQIG